MPNFDLGDYVDVNERLAWFFDRYPEGSLQADILERGEDYVVIKALAYRSPMDDRPGSGMASEPIPGRTPYTKDSEIMVGETSAWGRALAAIGAPTKGSIASRQEVANRTSPAAGPADVPASAGRATTPTLDSVGAGGTMSPATQVSESSDAEAAPEPGGSRPIPSGSTKTYPIDPAKCDHKLPSGRWIRWDADGRCPKCGTPKVSAMEGTTADLGSA